MTSATASVGPAIPTIIPTYDRASLLPRAIESALRESSPGDVVLVLDDGSR